MGTSATVRFKYKGDNPILVNVRHHNDGYIEGVGYDLAKFLLSKKIVNGISDFDDRNAIANGFSCLIAQYISNVKKCPGSVYICPQDFEGDYNYDVVYNDCKNKICIKVTHFDKVLFKGSPKELLEYKEGEDKEEKINMTDAVSRHSVLDTLDKMDKALDDDRSVERYKELLTECYKDLPPVLPKKSEEAQPKQTDDNCLGFDFDKVKEILKKDNLDNLIVDYTCEKKQEQTRDEKMIDDINFAIKATDSQDDYSMGMRNGMRYVKSLIDSKEPQYELRQTDEEIKLGIELGDELVGDYGAKGVVVGMDIYKGEVLLSLLMRNHKVPQLIKASGFKTKTGRHFPQIIEVLEQMKGEADGK